MENHKKKFKPSLKQINNRVLMYWDEPTEGGIYISYLVKKNNWCIFHKQEQVGSIGLKNKRLVDSSQMNISMMQFLMNKQGDPYKFEGEFEDYNNMNLRDNAKDTNSMTNLTLNAQELAS